jgi:hypothetical protein
MASEKEEEGPNQQVAAVLGNNETDMDNANNEAAGLGVNLKREEGVDAAAAEAVSPETAAAVAIAAANEALNTLSATTAEGSASPPPPAEGTVATEEPSVAVDPPGTIVTISEKDVLLGRGKRVSEWYVAMCP